MADINKTFFSTILPNYGTVMWSGLSLPATEKQKLLVLLELLINSSTTDGYENNKFAMFLPAN